jgi:hypothetical protein
MKSKCKWTLYNTSVWVSGGGQVENLHPAWFQLCDSLVLLPKDQARGTDSYHLDSHKDSMYQKVFVLIQRN